MIQIRDFWQISHSKAKGLRVLHDGICKQHGSWPVSSIYIWSENLVAESEAKDGGNWRPVPVLSIVFVRAVNTNWRPVPVPLNCFSCFDVDLKKNTVVLWTDNMFSDTIR